MVRARRKVGLNNFTAGKEYEIEEFGSGKFRVKDDFGFVYEYEWEDHYTWTYWERVVT